MLRTAALIVTLIHALSAPTRAFFPSDPVIVRHHAQITWSAPPDTDVVTFVVGIGDESRNYTYLYPTHDTTFTHENPTPGWTFYAAVRAQDRAGNISAWSEEVSYRADTSTVRCDTNGDGKTNFFDWIFMRWIEGKSPTPATDFNGDNIQNAADTKLWTEKCKP